jgi:VanZ family protein
MDFHRFFKYWFPVLLAMAFIFWMSTKTFSAENTYIIIEPILRFFSPSLSRRKIAVIHWVIRKLAHLTEYFISGLLLFRAFRSGSSERWKWRWVYSTLVVVLLLAASDEFHQSFVPNRDSNAMDVGYDSAGAFVGIAVYLMVRRLPARRVSSE